MCSSALCQCLRQQATWRRLSGLSSTVLSIICHHLPPSPNPLYSLSKVMNTLLRLLRSAENHLVHLAVRSWAVKLQLCQCISLPFPLKSDVWSTLSSSKTKGTFRLQSRSEGSGHQFHVRTYRLSSGPAVRNRARHFTSSVAVYGGSSMPTSQAVTSWPAPTDLTPLWPGSRIAWAQKT